MHALPAYVAAFSVLCVIDKGYVFSSKLQVTSLDLNNHTIKTNATSDIFKPTDRTTQMKISDGSSRSEIYKMHNNGLMLLHAQRAHLGPETKKSNLLKDSDSSSSINYHVRSRTNVNNASNTVTENQKHFKAMLGNMPQVHQKRAASDLVPVPSPVPFIPENIKLKPCSHTEEKRTSGCSPKITRNKLNKSHHRLKHKFKSLIQGESTNGNEIKKRNIYPQLRKYTSSPSELDILSDEDTNYEQYEPIDTSSKKHERLRRAFNLMSTPFDEKQTMNSLNGDNPLFDADQPEAAFRREYEQRRKHLKRKKIEKLYSRGIGGNIEAIPNIPDIRSAFDKIVPLKPYPQFPDFHPAIGDYPRFGVPELKLLNFPRFGQPNMDDYENIPGIPHIRPLSRGDEVTGDRRGFPMKSDFYDEELDDSVEHIERAKEMTPPTPITDITSISSITDIADIKPIPDVPTKPGSRSGVNGKMPVVQTVDTKYGKETQVSA